MSALGYHVWMIRFVAFVFAGFWSGVAGLLFLYYHQFVSPHACRPSRLGGGAADGDLRRHGHAPRPDRRAPRSCVVMKNVASAYVERWNFVLGAIFVFIVVFMPGGLVPGPARARRRAWRASRPHGAGEAPAAGRHERMTALAVQGLDEVVRRPQVTRR